MKTNCKSNGFQIEISDSDLYHDSEKNEKSLLI